MVSKTPKRIPELGPLEFKLLRLVWKNTPASAGKVLEVHNRHAGKKLKYTTVMTLLTRMAEKGVLSVDRTRLPFEFSARVGRDQVLRQRLGELVDVFFEGRTVDLALRLVEESELSEESLERLRELLGRQRRAGGGEKG